MPPFVGLCQYTDYYGEAHAERAHQLRCVQSPIRFNCLEYLFNTFGYTGIRPSLVFSWHSYPLKRGSRLPNRRPALVEVRQM